VENGCGLRGRFYGLTHRNKDDFGGSTRVLDSMLLVLQRESIGLDLAYGRKQTSTMRCIQALAVRRRRNLGRHFSNGVLCHIPEKDGTLLARLYRVMKLVAGAVFSDALI